jgi:hypothetical protein
MQGCRILASLDGIAKPHVEHLTRTPFECSEWMNGTPESDRS